MKNWNVSVSNATNSTAIGTMRFALAAPRRSDSLFLDDSQGYARNRIRAPSRLTEPAIRSAATSQGPPHQSDEQATALYLSFAVKNKLHADQRHRTASSPNIALRSTLSRPVSNPRFPQMAITSICPKPNVALFPACSHSAAFRTGHAAFKSPSTSIQPTIPHIGTLLCCRKLALSNSYRYNRLRVIRSASAGNS